MNEIKNKMVQLKATMSSLVFERDREINGMLCALMAGEHIYVGGPPGSGKSYMGKTLLALIDGATDFANTFTAFSTPDEVVGPFDPSEIMKGNMIRKTDGMLPKSHLARLEEIFKSNAGCLGILTDILVDGCFVEQGQAKKIPLLQALATSNELPQDESLAYLWDRFALRYWVGYLKSRNNRLKTLGFRKGLKMPTPIISLREIQDCRELVKNTEVSIELQEKLLDIQEALAKDGFILSDRRLGRLQEVCHADMVIFGTEVEDAVMHLADGSWQAVEDYHKVRQIVHSKANPEMALAQSAIDRIQIASDEIDDIIARNLTQSDKLSQAGTKIGNIKRDRDTLMTFKQTAKVIEFKARAEEIIKDAERRIFLVVQGR